MFFWGNRNDYMQNFAYKGARQNLSRAPDAKVVENHFSTGTTPKPSACKTGYQTPCLPGASRLPHLLYHRTVRSLRARGVSDKPWAPVYYSSWEILGFIEKIQDSWAISFVCVWFHGGGLAFVYLPTGSVTEHNKAFFVRPLYEGHTGVLLPVSHGLLKNGPLASWKDRWVLIIHLWARASLRCC